MPSFYNMPAQFDNAVIEDVGKFAQLPFYLVKNEVKVFPRWNVFDQLYGTIDWEPNMGTTMTGITPQPSPVMEAFFLPAEITGVPNKNVYEVDTVSQSATLKLHRYESKQFNFIPSFQAFWRDYIKFADTDIARQEQVSNNMFIRSQMWAQTPNIFIAGVGLVPAPTGAINNANNLAGSKNQAYIQGTLIPQVKTNLTLRTMYSAAISMREDLGAPEFEGSQNMPKDNEGLKGKYVFLGSTEAWDMLPFDKDTQLLKSITLDLLFEDFNGLLFGKNTYKFDPFPLRFDANGVAVAPQVQIAPGNPNALRTIPNPLYVNPATAPYEVAWLMGADAFKTIKVGPPPKEFGTKNMSANKFYSLRWNGEIQLTDQVLITYADGTIDLNVYGTQLKFIAQCTHGILAGDPRFAMPIFFQRSRPALMA